MSTAVTKFRIDVDIHNLLNNASRPTPAEPKGLSLPVPVFPQYPEKLDNPGPRDSATGQPQMGHPSDLSHDARLAVTVCKVAGASWRVSPDHFIPIRRVQVQSGLLVLLVL